MKHADFGVIDPLKEEREVDPRRHTGRRPETSDGVAVVNPTLVPVNETPPPVAFTRTSGQLPAFSRQLHSNPGPRVC